MFTNMPLLDPAMENFSITDMSLIYKQLRYLTAQIPRSDSKSISDMNMLAFSKARCMIERALSVSSATLPTRESVGGTIDILNLAFEAQRISALIYVNVVLRHCLPSERLLVSLKSQLIRIFETIESHQPHFQYRREASLWCFIMGGMVTISDAEELWFAERIAKIVRNLGLYSWQDLEATLDEVVWVDSLRSGGWSLWQRVQGLLDLQDRG